MEHIIISMKNCQKCEMLKALVPDAKVVEVEPAEILDFARKVGIQSMPFVVSVGGITELEKVVTL